MSRRSGRGKNKKAVQPVLPKQPKQSDPFLKLAPEVKSQNILHARRMESFSGPIPPPQTLAQYNHVIPNGADRILKMAEEQAAHRQDLEKTVVRSDKRLALCGMILGFVLALSLGGGGIYLVSQGHSLQGLTAVLAPITALVGAFIYAQESRKRERLQRNPSKEPSEEQLSLGFD